MLYELSQIESLFLMLLGPFEPFSKIFLVFSEGWRQQAYDCTKAHFGPSVFL